MGFFIAFAMIVDTSPQLRTTKSDIERVEQEKTTFTLLGRFLVKRGLKLFTFNPLTEKIQEHELKFSNTAKMISIEGKLTWCDSEHTSCVIDSGAIYFQSLNLRTAAERVNKFKVGKIADLCNLQAPGKIDY